MAVSRQVPFRSREGMAVSRQAPFRSGGMTVMNLARSRQGYLQSGFVVVSFVVVSLVVVSFVEGN